jgi:hypothetical protein
MFDFIKQERQAGQNHGWYIDFVLAAKSERAFAKAITHYKNELEKKGNPVIIQTEFITDPEIDSRSYLVRMYDGVSMVVLKQSLTNSTDCQTMVMSNTDFSKVMVTMEDWRLSQGLDPWLSKLMHN